VVKKVDLGRNDAETEGLGAASDDGAFSLRIVQGELAETHALPPGAELVVGRGRGVDIVIDDPSLSRRHAVIRVGQKVTIEDCGSQNGTRVGDAKLAPGERVELHAGTVIALGNVRGFVQRGALPRRPRRIWARVQFEKRMRDAIASDVRRSARFVFARWKLVGPVPAALVEETLLRAARAEDVVAQLGGDEYAFFFADRGRAAVDEALAPARATLTQAGARILAGVAEYPAEALSFEELVGRASADMATADARASSSEAPVAEMDRLRELVEKVAVGTIPVLLFGETGVGKELLAKEIHTRSLRAARPFVRLNCAAFSEDLLASELFGHEKGSFTGAHQAKAGLLEVAEGGTVFLDEIGELPLSMQAKLLRVFEERAVMRVGSLAPRPIDVRFVAATNRDLEAEAAAGRFRRDLFFRLSGVVISIRPLRERVAEIDVLARGFVLESAHAAKRASAPVVSEEALAVLRAHDWPGNVRELRNTMERAVLLCNGDAILPEHLPLDRMRSSMRAATATGAPPPPPPPPGAAMPLRAELAGIERARMLETLAQCGGNQTQAAKLLGISRGTLIARLAAYDVPRPRKRS
jgi:two-component system, NtrC family, response regulator AtoC